MADSAKFERIEITSAAELDAWLSAHHAQDESMWLVTWLVEYASRDEVLDALVAWGSTDGVRRKLDAMRTMQLIGPRRTEYWAKSYKDRVARLEAEGRMQAPGRAAVARARGSVAWRYMDDVDAPIVPDDLAAELDGAGAAAAFDAFAPSYRRNVLRWIKLAKTGATRSKRVATAAATASRGEKVPNF